MKRTWQSYFLEEYVAKSRNNSTRKQNMEFDKPRLITQRGTGVDVYSNQIEKRRGFKP